MADSPKPLNYNLRWIERTFGSRTATEALLTPERDAGNVSHNDYNAAVNFAAGSYPYYRFLGGILAIPVTLSLRRPSWTIPRTFGVLVATTLAGSFGGQAMTFSAHLRFIRSLEDPSGFAQAIENIQKNSPIPVPPGPVIVRAGNRSVFDSTEQSPTNPSPVTSNSPTKWDQIRTVNSHTSTNSSWDALRQNHERSRVPSSTTASQSADDTDAFQRSCDNDRAAEQAKFNELLERERNIK
ncbi:hypothetical protein C0991_000104 [Blastosporella zonata]|nr:hypothetical protein C0991_000104 [Blastosporella zonata]